MIPDHCKDVSIKDVDFELTREIILESMGGKKAYTRTDHLILRHGDEFAIVKVEKEDGKELFRPIRKLEIVSLPQNTVYVHDDNIDVLNPSHMARISELHKGKTVVVEGMFGHLSFVRDVSPIYLRVLDTIPPSPSKLSVLVDRGLSSGYVSVPIIPRVEDIDLNDLAKRVDSEGVVFPCQASNLSSDRLTYFLDRVPDIKADVELVGCHLSRRIFRSLYGKDVDMINICPWDLAPRDDVPTLVKCCKVKEGHVVDGNLIVVPWGASVREVIEAINDYFS